MNAYKGKGYSQDIDRHVGKKLREFRHRFGFTQQQVADKAGVKFQQVQKYETGMNRIAASRLWDFAKAFDISVNQFFPDEGGTMDMTFDKRTLEMIQKFTQLTETKQDTILKLIKEM